MPLLIDTNMRIFADRLNISTSRMINDYGLKTVDEIIESETERGNNQAVDYARRCNYSSAKLIKLFKLADVDNKFAILDRMNEHTRMQVLPLLKSEDLVFGLNFFTQEKLLSMLMEADPLEVINVVQEAFSMEEIVTMLPEEDLSLFFLNQDLKKEVVMKEIKNLDPEILKKFIEGVTGMPSDEAGEENFLQQLDQMTEKDFKKFMSLVDPDIQRQLIFQINDKDNNYLQMISKSTYVKMMSTLLKPDMIKPLIKLSNKTLLNMVAKLPKELMCVVATQVDTEKFATFLQRGRMYLLKNAVVY